MYEPIRTKSVHTVADESAEGGYPGALAPRSWTSSSRVTWRRSSP